MQANRLTQLTCFLDDPSLTMAEHKMEQKLKDMGWNLTLCEERDRQKFNEMPELRFLKWQIGYIDIADFLSIDLSPTSLVIKIICHQHRCSRLTSC